MQLGKLAFISLAVAAAARADTLDVPGDFATLQAAIDGASDGDVILVHGGTHDPIVIDKPLTILGDPLATIDNTDFAPLGEILPAIELAGPGRGRVVLGRLRTAGTAGGETFSMTAEGLRGGGFDELALYDCEIRPAAWVMLTGVGIGAPAISVSVPDVSIVRSTVVGGQTQTDSCDYDDVPGGARGVEAVGSTVLVLDSTIRGGDGPDLCFFGDCDQAPCPCPDFGGAGGVGIICTTLFRAGSTIAGGDGQTVYCAGSPVGSQPDGRDTLVSLDVPLDSDLTGSGPLDQGTLLTLSYASMSAPTFLVVGAPAPALSLGGSGWLFLEPSALLLLPVASGSQMVTVNLVPDAALVGTQAGLQVWDPVGGLTRPYLGVFLP